MRVEIRPIEIKDKEILRKMLGDYEEEITGKDEEYKYLDSYWEEKNRWPFFILVDEKVAGFVLVNEHLILSEKAPPTQKATAGQSKNVSEFYIKKEYRAKGIGREAALKIFETFEGKWEVREIKENPKAREFWLKVISAYTQGNFKEIEMDNEKWQGWVQTFDSFAL
ncbi:MAG: GNAT family N-acetyltransferase, partial [Candidatus Shapirobacteria bacterium]